METNIFLKDPKELNMDSLSGDLVEKISFILGDLKVFHALLNSTPQLIRQNNIHARAVERFTQQIIDVNGTQYWYLNGKLHRENDLPAYIGLDGSRQWYLNGKRHRENDLPAYIGLNGTQWWCLNGKLHRENDLPAYINSGGTHAWYLNGNQYLPERLRLKRIKHR